MNQATTRRVLLSTFLAVPALVIITAAVAAGQPFGFILTGISSA
jgi:hypothetical protein